MRARLESAAKANLVRLDPRDIAATLASLAAAAARGPRQQRPGRSPVEPRTGADLASLLPGGLDARKADAFARAWFAHDGDTASYWDKPPRVRGFDAPAVAECAQLLLPLDTLTLGNLGVTGKRIADRVTAVSDLARHDVAGWMKLLAGTGMEEVPATAPAMAATVEIAFPHAWVSARGAEAPREDEAALVGLTAKHPALDLATTRVGTFTAKNALPDDSAAALARTTRVLQPVRGPDRLVRMAHPR